MTMYKGETQPVIEKIPNVALTYNVITFVAAVGPSPIPTEPVQGPDFEVPPGHAVVIKARTTQGGNPTFWIGDSAAAVKTSPNLAIQKNDYEPYVKLWIANTNILWLASNVVGAILELYIE